MAPAWKRNERRVRPFPVADPAATLFRGVFDQYGKTDWPIGRCSRSATRAGALVDLRLLAAVVDARRRRGTTARRKTGTQLHEPPGEFHEEVALSVSFISNTSRRPRDPAFPLHRRRPWAPPRILIDRSIGEASSPCLNRMSTVASSRLPVVCELACGIAFKCRLT